MSKHESERRPLLELLLIAMGAGGIGLTLIISAIIIATGLVLQDGTAGVIAGLGLGIIGFTAGIGLISLSYILRYLRIIAAGSGIGRTFE